MSEQLPKTFTFKIRNPEFLQKNEQGGMKMEEKNVKIRHKALAKKGLTIPVKFRVLAKPIYDVTFDEKGEAEVPQLIADKVLALGDGLYEIVIEPEPEVKKEPPEPEVAKPEAKKKPGPKPKSEKADPACSEEEKQFVKSITG